jgi:hypothetical protein
MGMGSSSCSGRGVGFFEDYERFYRRRQQGELQWAFHDDHRQISEPLKVAYLFTEKRTGHPANSITFVPTKDVETATLVLAALGFDDVPAFLDYALAEAKKTNFDIQTLGGTKQYLPSFLALRQRKAADKAQQAARKVRQQEDAQRQAYITPALGGRRYLCRASQVGAGHHQGPGADPCGQIRWLSSRQYGRLRPDKVHNRAVWTKAHHIRAMAVRPRGVRRLWILTEVGAQVL